MQLSGTPNRMVEIGAAISGISQVLKALERIIYLEIFSYKTLAIKQNYKISFNNKTRVSNLNKGKLTSY